MSTQKTKVVDIETIFKRNRTKAAEAIDNMGGPAAAGRALTERVRLRGGKVRVTIGKVWSWLNRDKRGIPIEYLIDIEEESGIKREELRQDIPWRKIS